MEKRKKTTNYSKKEQEKDSTPNAVVPSEGAAHHRGDRKRYANHDIGKKQYKGSCQDAFWYAKDKGAIDNMASFPFLKVMGDSIARQGAKAPFAIMANYRPTIGGDVLLTANADDPAQNTYLETVNYKTKAADAYYQYITQGYTGAIDSFEAPDLLMAALAASSLVALFEEGRRAFGCSKYFLQFNRSYAKDIIEGALSFNYVDLASQKADFCAQYNILAEEFNKVVALPKGFTICDRWKYISQSLFTDTSEPEFSTMYGWRAQAFLKYNATAATTGTCLQWVYRDMTTPLTKQNYFSLIEDLLSALISSDTRTMFGAIRRVYSEADLYKVEELDQNYLTTIVQNDIVAMQFHNMKWIGNKTALAPSAILPAAYQSGSEGESLKNDIPVFQDATGEMRSIITVVETPSTFNVNPASDHPMVLDLYDHLVSAENILDATTNMMVRYRLTSPAQAGLPSGSNLLVCRTELITSLNAVYYNDSNVVTNESVSDYYQINIASTGGTSTSDVEAFLRQIGLLTKMDSHPLIFQGNGSSILNGGYASPSNIIGETDHYTNITGSDMIKLHNRCQYQLLSLPANEKSVTRK